MSILKVDTLGCHPMLLLKKMAAAGGITILKEEKKTFSDVDYPYRIVAQVGENMYLEAHDFIHEAATTEEELPSVEGDSYPFPWSHTKLEAEESDKNQSASPSASDGTLVIPSSLRGDEDATLCMLIAWRGMSEDATQGDGSLLSTFASTAIPVVNFIEETAQNFEENLIMTANADDCYWAKASGSPHVFLKCPERPSTNWPFVIATGVDGWLSLWPSDNNCNLYFGAINGKPPSIPVIVSASRIRIATSVDESFELVSPSAWKGLPIFTSVTKAASGLFFEVGPAGKRGAVLAVLAIDTEKGNGFGEGACLALYENVPKFFRATGQAAPQRESLLVCGTPANATASKTMSAYIATPPVSQDVVVGGPVVSEVYAFDSDEIRGAIKGVLGISENVDVGTMGWLDGKRYRVLLPGRMTQVG